MSKKLAVTKDQMVNALKCSSGQRAKAARMLGISTSKFYLLVAEYGIPLPEAPQKGKSNGK